MVVGDFAEERDTMIIGAGPGGYVAAIRAAELGQKVTVVEKEYIGGVCLNVGCIPSKALISAGHRFQEAKDSKIFGIKNIQDPILDFKVTQDWKDHQVVDRLTGGVEMLLKKHKVEVVRGEAYMHDNHTLRVMNGDHTGQTYKFKHLIIATGSRPVEIPGFKFSGRVVDSTGGLNLPEVPKELVVIGGGYIGSELAGAYANLGAHVTILEGTPQILPNFEKDMVKLVLNSFKKKGVDVITNAMAKNSEQDDSGVTVTYAVDGKETEIHADYVMVTVGRRPNTDDMGLEYTDVKLTKRGLIEVDEQGRTAAEDIYAIGDIVAGAALAHKAFAEAKVAAGAISGKKTANDYVSIPAVCFTDPELATVGMTKADAEAAGLQVKTSKFPFAGNGRAISLNSMDGFFRLVSTKDEGTIVGAQIAGPGASDLISELSVAVNGGMNVEDLALTIHPHPTLGEAVQEAADEAMGYPTHI